MVIRRVGAMSVAKLSGVLYAIIGLIVGAFMSLLMMASGAMAGAGGADSFAGMPMIGAAAGVGAIVILPILYGILGFIGGAIGAAIYNLVAGWTGGIEVDIQ